MRFPAGRILVGVAFLTSAVITVTAQTTPKKQDPPVFGSSVALVAVPVFVTDKSGKSVVGLKPEDFEIEDGGKPTPIVAFQALDVDQASTEESRSEIAELPLAVQAVARRQFLLLIDMRFSPRAGLTFGRKAATAYVRDSLAPNDLVAVATSGPAGLKVLTNFTSDHEYIAKVIEGTSTAGRPSADPLGLSSAGISGGVGSLISDSLGGLSGISAGGGSGTNADAELAAQDQLMAQAAAGEERNSSIGFLGDLQKLIANLAPLRGRKQVVLFSGGFSEASWNSIDGLPVLKKMEDVYKDANRADVVIHTVDLMGIQPAMDMTSQTGPNGGLDSGGVPTTSQGALNQGSGRGTLIALSLNTGGRAIRPRGDFGKAFGEVDQISRHSYILAFEAADADSKSSRGRSLKVRVKRPGLSVSHRPEYFPGAAAAPSTDSGRLLATEAIAKGLTGGPLKLHLVALPYRDAAGNASVHAVLRIDGGSLGEAAKGKDMAIQVYGYAMDGGRVLDGIALNTSVDLAKMGAAIRSSGINIVTAFPATHGALDLRFFVRAGMSDLTGSIQQDVAVPAFAAGSRVISMPMFLLPSTGQVVVPFQPANRPRIPIPFYAGDARLVPDTTAVLTPGKAREVLVFVWRDGGSASSLSVTGELDQAGGNAQPVRIEGSPRIASEADGFDRYLVSVVAPDVSAGSYRLRLNFRDAATGRVSRSETAVEIER